MTTGGRDDTDRNSAGPAFDPSTVDEATSIHVRSSLRGGEGAKNWWQFWPTFQSQSPDRIESRRRQRAEVYLARFFLDTAMKHGREIVNQKRDQLRVERDTAGASSRFTAGGVLNPAAIQAPESVTNALTEDEQEVFRRTAYYGWMEGTGAGLATFLVLFGGLRWAAARRGGGGGLARTTAQLAMMPPPPRPGYQQLDGISARRSTLSRATSATTAPASASSPTPTSLLGASDDVMMQLQFMCIGAMSLVVGNLVAQACTDQERLFRQVERVPLLPGRSVLCHRMCPDMIEQHRSLLRHNSWERLIYGRGESPEEGETPEDASSRQHASVSSRGSMRAQSMIPPPESYMPDYTPGDLLKDPETQELESIVHLLQNCQARIRYESQLREEDGTDSGVGDDAEAIVTIPPPGVPPSTIASEYNTMCAP